MAILFLSLLLNCFYSLEIPAPCLLVNCQRFGRDFQYAIFVYLIGLKIHTHSRIVLQESLWSLREFIYVNLSECHFHRVGIGYCESPDFAAAFTEFEDLAIAAG